MTPRHEQHEGDLGSRLLEMWSFLRQIAAQQGSFTQKRKPPLSGEYFQLCIPPFALLRENRINSTLWFIKIK
jgi:hypothetical protein